MKSGEFALTKDALYSNIYNSKLVKCSSCTVKLKYTNYTFISRMVVYFTMKITKKV